MGPGPVGRGHPQRDRLFRPARRARPQPPARTLRPAVDRVRRRLHRRHARPPAARRTLRGRHPRHLRGLRLSGATLVSLVAARQRPLPGAARTGRQDLRARRLPAQPARDPPRARRAGPRARRGAGGGRCGRVGGDRALGDGRVGDGRAHRGPAPAAPLAAHAVAGRDPGAGRARRPGDRGVLGRALGGVGRAAGMAARLRRRAMRDPDDRPGPVGALRRRHHRSAVAARSCDPDGADLGCDRPGRRLADRDPVGALPVAPPLRRDRARCAAAPRGGGAALAGRLAIPVHEGDRGRAAARTGGPGGVVPRLRVQGAGQYRARPGGGRRRAAGGDAGAGWRPPRRNQRQAAAEPGPALRLRTQLPAVRVVGLACARGGAGADVRDRGHGGLRRALAPAARDRYCGRRLRARHRAEFRVPQPVLAAHLLPRAPGAQLPGRGQSGPLRPAGHTRADRRRVRARRRSPRPQERVRPRPRR